MVTGSKKPKDTDKAPKDASKAKPKASKAKPKAAAVRPSAAKPKKTTTKPKTTVSKAKTVKKTAVKAPKVRKVGEMVYNDELFESLAEAVLLAEAEMEGLLPDVKGQLFDYDIYLTSFLSDGEVGEIATYLAGNGRGISSAEALKPKLLAVRDHARVFVRIAEEHNSVKAFIDRIIEAEGRDRLKMTFSGGKFHLKDVHPDTFESFLLLF